MKNSFLLLFWFLVLPYSAQVWSQGDGLDHATPTTPTISEQEINETLNGIFARWDNANDPLLLGGHLQRSFHALPVSGRVRSSPWSGSYWPSNVGGIAYRWASGGQNRASSAFAYGPLPAQTLSRLTEAQMALLSPAEKYDILMERFDYPTYRVERSRTNPRSPQWYGLCHGWASSTLNFPIEPRPVVMTSPSGLRVPFGSADIKALLAFYQGHATQAPARYLGRRCNGAFNYSHYYASGECTDTNAGAFHVALGNLIGRMGRSFVADFDAGAQVWNFPVVAYQSQIYQMRNGPSAGASYGTVREAFVRTVVHHANIDHPKWQQSGTLYGKRVYDYKLEIDGAGQIIGGTWLGRERPDFLWIQAAPSADGYYGRIHDIYRSSVGY